jgi:porin
MNKRQIGFVSRRQKLLSARMMVHFLLGVAFYVCSAATAVGQEEPFPPISGNLGWEGGMLSDWARRKEMADSGVTFLGVNQTMGLGNPSGGTSSEFEVVNRFVLQFHFDLEKLFSWSGSEFVVSGSRNDGKNLGDNVGTPYNPSTLYQPPATRLWQLYFGQFFHDEQVHLKIGRVSANNNDFAYTPFEFGFASAAYDSASTAMFQNYKGFGGEPIAQWGARLAIQQHERDDYLRLGFYNADPPAFAGDDALARPSVNGLDFRFNPGDGAVFLAEYGYRLNQDPEDSGLPGTYKIGSIYDTSPFDRFDFEDETKRGLWGVYLQADQMVYREGGGGKAARISDQGLTLWGSVGLHPDQKVAAFPYYISWGMTYKGLFPGRDNDDTYFGNYYSKNSKYNGGGTEVQLEASHIFHFFPWLQIGPTIQYVFRPGGTGTIDDALILGFQALIVF